MLNYGACLQCFALFQRIKTDYGYCEVIDLLRPLQSGYRISRNFPGEMSMRRMLSLYKYRYLTWIRKSKSERVRDKRFEEFNRMVDYSHCYRSLQELYNNPPQYDLYVTGSDQVWSPNLPFVNEPYFLSFAPEKARKVSYASSFGIDSLAEYLKVKYAERLSQYENISVREKSGAEIVRKLTGKEVPVVMDPVFLLAPDEWRKYERSLNGVEPGSYVFLYMLHFNANILKIAEQFARAKNKKLYFCLSELGERTSDYGTQIVDAGPREWLWLIDNSDTVVTTSFHGSAMTAIFGRPLVILTKNGVSTNTRIENLTSKLGLENHVCDIDSCDDLSERDFSLDSERIDNRLAEEVRASLDYLSAVIPLCV